MVRVVVVVVVVVVGCSCGSGCMGVLLAPALIIRGFQPIVGSGWAHFHHL